MPSIMSKLLVASVAMAVVVSGKEVDLLKKHRNLAAASSLTDLFASSATGTSEAVKAAQAAAQMMASTALGAGDPEADIINRMFKGEVNDMELVSGLLDSDGFGAIQAYPEFVKDVLDAFPALDAIPSLKALRADKTVDDTTLVGTFAQGLKDVVTTMASTLGATTKQDGMTNVVDSIIKDTANADLLTKFKAGDVNAVKELNQKVDAKLFPGIDTGALWDLYSTTNVLDQYKKLQDNDAVMSIVDADEHMSNLIRNPVDFRDVVSDWGFVNKE